jgi:hypothetical protein
MAQEKWNMLGICILWELRIDAFWNMAWWMVILLEVMNTRVVGGSKFTALTFLGLRDHFEE